MLRTRTVCAVALLCLFGPVHSMGATKSTDWATGRVTDEGKFKPSNSNIFIYVVWNLTYHQAREKQPYPTISGEVRGFNVGIPKEGVPVLIGWGDDRPFLVGMTDAFGRFNFRVQRRKMGRPNKGPVEKVKPYLYFGGVIEPVGEGAEIPLGKASYALRTGSETRRFDISRLMKD